VEQVFSFLKIFLPIITYIQTRYNLSENFSAEIEIHKIDIDVMILKIVSPKKAFFVQSTASYCKIGLIRLDLKKNAAENRRKSQKFEIYEIGPRAWRRLGDSCWSGCPSFTATFRTEFSRGLRSA
jgi:hypothetical protein